ENPASRCLFRKSGRRNTRRFKTSRAVVKWTEQTCSNEQEEPSMTQEVRVRYAPSPTGHLHIGNARTALFNYLYARHNGGKFIIRIEDTDAKRNIEGGEESQPRYLKWLGIAWDESIDVGGEYGPYRQSERNDLYKQLYDGLLEKGLAYKCYCTEEELEAEREAQQASGEMQH